MQLNQNVNNIYRRLRGHGALSSVPIRMLSSFGTTQFLVWLRSTRNDPPNIMPPQQQHGDRRDGWALDLMYGDAVHLHHAR